MYTKSEDMVNYKISPVCTPIYEVKIQENKYMPLEKNHDIKTELTMVNNVTYIHISQSSVQY